MREGGEKLESEFPVKLEEQFSDFYNDSASTGHVQV